MKKPKSDLKQSLTTLLNEERKDRGITFEELNVTYLFIDEAHLFKNLGFRTRHTRLKGLPRSESQRATDLYLKMTHLREKHGDRVAAFATGTPVSNSIAEMYIMQLYLQPGVLSEYDILEFDAWAGTFADIVTEVELAPSGQGFRTTRSFSKFVNIPELIGLYSRVADTQTAEMLNLPRPKLEIVVVETEMSARETAIMEQLVRRAEAIKGKRPEKGADNILKIMGEGLRLALDIRLLDPSAPINPHGTVIAAVANITQIYREGQYPGLCQIAFCDAGTPGSKAGLKPAVRDGDGDHDDDGEEDFDSQIHHDGPFNLYEDIRARLVENGIPREEIAFIHEADNDLKKARLFAAVRQGKVRILLGSTAKMGVGTNVQRLLKAMHHLDAPWRPADDEQRNGRIIRQGNLNTEVKIFRYITLRSLVAYKWQILTRKANFIAQLRAGARGVRTAEDIDSPLPEADMIKAAATGNPLIIEQAELAKELRELEAGQRGHERSIIAAKSAHERLLVKIAGLRRNDFRTGGRCGRRPTPGKRRICPLHRRSPLHRSQSCRRGPKGHPVV